MDLVWDYDLFKFSVHAYVSFAVYIVQPDLISGEIYETLEHWTKRASSTAAQMSQTTVTVGVSK
jgi:hypothetical protein